MDFVTAVKTCLNKYADFNGRARRSEFWFFYLFYIIVYFVAAIIDGVLVSLLGIPVLTWIVALVLFIPELAVSARRLHDTGRSGWWILIALVPLVGAILLIVWWATNGTPGSNQYGDNPKGE